jgi:ferrous iron transport protein B
LRKFGVSGRSVLSFVLGLGCNVSAIMSLRGLTKHDERVLAGMVIPFVPCSARTVVIMALVTGILGVLLGMFMYFLSFLVILSVLLIINKLSKFNPPHIMVHVPPYRLPSLKSIWVKIWIRMKSFMFTAWPALIIGTILVNYISFFKVDDFINTMFSFLTVDLLNLPKETAIPLLFGVLAKEYALVMLYSALGTENVTTVLSNIQIITFAVFTLLYTPCISTIATQVKEIGWKYTIISIVLSISIAIVISFLIGRGLNVLFAKF